MEVSRCDSRYLCFILERMHPSAPHNLKVHSVVLPFDFLFALPLIACVIRLSLGLEKNLAFLPSQCKSISCTCDLCYKAFQMDPCHFSNSFKLQTSLRYLNFTGTLFPTSIYTLKKFPFFLLIPVLHWKRLWWFDPDARHSPETLCLSPPQWDRGEKT